MVNLMTLAPFTRQGLVRVVVESPGDARVKLKYEPRLRIFEYNRALPAGLVYPYDWGFVPATVGEDGDPLDGMILHDAQTFPGTVFECRPIAVLEVEQTEAGKTIRNDRYFFRPAEARRRDDTTRQPDVSARDRRDLERFFSAAVSHTNKRLELLGWKSADAAIEGLRKGARAYARRRTRQLSRESSTRSKPARDRSPSPIRERHDRRRR